MLFCKSSTGLAKFSYSLIVEHILLDEMSKELHEKEKAQLVNQYRQLLRHLKHLELSNQAKADIRAAFKLASEAHRGMRRKSGEAYIFHPLTVAIICASEIGLGSTSIIAALLHDVVEDTDVTIEEVEGRFGTRVATIIHGLTKLKSIVGKSNSLQAENFRKILLTMAEDVRVILIKLADRLHNMRTLESMSRQGQIKISSETLELFAPLAHRLGLYNLKTELEDLSLKYTHPEKYEEITSKLDNKRSARNRYIRRFIEPLQKTLAERGYQAELTGRPKSIYSIYSKMQRQNITFDEVYDLFAIRVILDVDPVAIVEQEACWNVYSLITQQYYSNISRLRDWVSHPKSNGYESLHITVMGPEGKWVEVQIRTRRMHDIAEKGYAAHWKYKENSSSKEDNKLDDWLNQVRELLEHPESDALKFLDEFKLNLLSDEIVCFTPRGDMITLPKGGTALDFAFAIHTQVGTHCLGAKVNSKLVPLNTQLNNGDQVEIITSRSQKPTEDWLKYAATARAKNRIKSALKNEKRSAIHIGRALLEQKLSHKKIKFTTAQIKRLADLLNMPTEADLYFAIGSNKLRKKNLTAALLILEEGRDAVKADIEPKAQPPVLLKKNEDLVIADLADIQYSFAKCCHPIPGDAIMAYITSGRGITIHQCSCRNAIRLAAHHADKVHSARWGGKEASPDVYYTVDIRLSGIDGLGLVSQVTNIISKEMQVYMRKMQFDSEGGTFEGTISLDVTDQQHLTGLMLRLKQITGIESVTRTEVQQKIKSLEPEALPSFNGRNGIS